MFYTRRMSVRALFREPLLHFLLIGTVVFGVHHAFGQPPTQSSDGPIVVDAQVRERLKERFTVTRGHPPTDEDMKDVISKWIDEEVLVREGLARGLERDDPRIHERIADKMRVVLQASVEVPSPTHEDLVKWWEANRARWSRPSLVDFTQVFVEGDDSAARARAQELLAKLQAGAEPAGLGDRFSGGRHYRQRSLPSLAEALGDEFIQGLSEQAEKTWSLRRSRYGLHLVRVDKWTPAATSDFESCKLDVAKDWKEAQRTRVLEAAMRELRNRWPIERRP